MEYEKTIRKSLEFIEENLKNDVKTSDIAKEVKYSRFHFDRLFLAVVGTTVADYLRRRRLTEAAITLLERQREIIQIAFDYGFESQESFTRAFKKQFATTPAKYRKLEIAHIAQYQLRIDLINSGENKGDKDMKPKIVHLKGIKVVGLSKNYSIDKPNDIPELWNEFNRRVGEIRNAVINGRDYGVCIKSDKEAEEFEYLACVEVDGFENIPGGMTEHQMPNQRYAVFTAMGVQNIKPTFEYAYGTWANGSDYELEKSSDFELYDQRFDPENPTEGEIDIYIPIK